jgi:putative transposase
MIRKTEFTNNEYYHIYNRGVDKREVFMDEKDYERFLTCLILLNDKKEGAMLQWRDYQRLNPKAKPLEFQRFRLDEESRLVEITAYCLNKNHYHFILKQIEEKGIEKFMQKLGTSYTMYFNQKYKRSGSLFQGVFKSVHIDSNDYLLYLSAYVNENNFIHKYSKRRFWKYSSFPEYLGYPVEEICVKDVIMGQFKNKDDYQKFSNNNAEYMKDKKEMEKMLLE